MATRAADMAEHFLQKAVPKSHRGIFTAKAKRAGMSVQQYARRVLASKGSSTKLKREAAFAKTAGRPGGFGSKGKVERHQDAAKKLYGK